MISPLPAFALPCLSFNLQMIFLPSCRTSKLLLSLKTQLVFSTFNFLTSLLTYLETSLLNVVIQVNVFHTYSSNSPFIYKLFDFSHRSFLGFLIYLLQLCSVLDVNVFTFIYRFQIFLNFLLIRVYVCRCHTFHILCFVKSFVLYHLMFRNMEYLCFHDLMIIEDNLVPRRR